MIAFWLQQQRLRYLNTYVDSLDFGEKW